MITEENLDEECREIHYVSENGRVEGLILEKEERVKRERPKSAKGRRRPGALIIDSSRCNRDIDGSCRTYNTNSINEQGVNDLFSDILYDPENKDSSDIENIDDDDKSEKLLGSEEAYFYKLQSLIPYLTSKSTTKLDILLETITYINMMQNKLLQKTCMLGWNGKDKEPCCDTILFMYLCKIK